LINNILILVGLVLSLFLIYSCGNNREKIVDKSKLTGDDYRLFQQTLAWKLAKAVSDQNISNINRILKEEPNLIDFQEPIFGNTLIMMTIQNQQYNSFEELIKNDANINLYDSSRGRSALIKSCMYDFYDKRFVKKLINRGANVNDLEVGERSKGNSTRNTPLIVASRSGNIELVKLLLENGANINFQNEYRHSALSKSIMVSQYETTLFLLENGADYTKPIFFRENEDREMFIRDVLEEDTRRENQRWKKKILSFLDKNEK